MTRSPEAGFTLVETLVALAVLSLSAMAFLAATEAHLARIGALEQRSAGLWAAQNHLAERGLGLDPAPEVEILGQGFALSEQVSATDDPDLQRLDITAMGADGRIHARLTGFLILDGGAP